MILQTTNRICKQHNLDLSRCTSLALPTAGSEDAFVTRCCFRYFQCEPKYGLFAPAHKIKKIADGHPPVTVDTPKAEENRAAAVTPEETVVPVSSFHDI